jgi:hypothetical protein
MAAERWLRTVPSDRDNRWASPAIVAVSVDAARTSRSRGERVRALGQGVERERRVDDAAPGSDAPDHSASWAAGASLREGTPTRRASIARRVAGRPNVVTTIVRQLGRAVRAGPPR